MFSKLRTLLVLGRVSNVPTVWSNCLAGWLLGGGGEWPRLAMLCAGAALLYIGGMFLNDAFDAEFDAQHRRERPIPSGAITRAAVWRLGFALLLAGDALMSVLGLATAIVAALLVASILLYDWLHKLITFSPVLMALCRFLLYLAAASTAWSGITALAVWNGLALAAYIVGLSFLARNEATGVTIQKWPQVLLLVPLLLAFLIDDGSLRQQMAPLGAILALWSVRSLRYVWIGTPNMPRAVSGLLAGIVWVDQLAVADSVTTAPRIFGAAFVALFLLALLFQRFVPAT